MVAVNKCKILNKLTQCHVNLLRNYNKKLNFTNKRLKCKNHNIAVDQIYKRILNFIHKKIIQESMTTQLS